MLSNAHANLCQVLGYAFSEPILLEEALTHRSADQKNNERLEYLGDAVLGTVIAAELFQHFALAKEGQLSRLRSNLVNKETLATIARDVHLGDCLRLGPGELKNGGVARSSILADALEAVFGAIYVDSGFKSARQVILNIYRDRIDSVGREFGGKDPKTRLQEFLQLKKRPLPEYKIQEITGKPHAQMFVVECTIDGLPSIQACGQSRRKAEQAVASLVLQQLNEL